MGIRRVLSDVTIASSGTTSGAIDCSGDHLVGLQTPSALTGTAFTFTGSTTLAGTYSQITDKSGSAVSVTVAASKYVALDPNLLQAPYIKIVSGSTEAAARVIIAVLRPMGWS